LEGNGLPAESRPSQFARLRFYLVLASLTTLGPFSLDMYLPGLPALAKDLGSTESTSQFTLTTRLFGLGIGQLLAGPISDTTGRRRPLIVGLATYVITALLCAVAPSIYPLIGFRLLQGIASGATAVIATAVVRDRYTGRAAARFFSLLVLVTLISPLFAPIFGGELLLVTSWRGVFLTLAVIGVGLVLVATLGLSETLPRVQRRGGGFRNAVQTMGRLAADRAFISYALPAALGGGAIFAYLAGSSFALQRTYGASPQVYGLLFALNGLALGVSSQTNRWLLGRVSTERLFRVGLILLAAAGVALLGTVALRLGGLWSVVVPVMAIITSNGFVGPNSLALALSPHADAAGTGSALFGALRFAIGGVMAPVVGIVGSSTALPLALTMSILCVGAGFTYLMTRPKPVAAIVAM
jgi:DHA1 family bicyclomycin/chloramphenicol resistance-like MFS transporter